MTEAPTKQSIASQIRLAAEAVDLAGLEPGLRLPAFEHALAMLGGRGVLAAPMPSVPEPLPVPRLLLAPTVDGILTRVGQKLGIDQDVVGRIFEVHDGQVRLIIKRSMLPSPNKKAASMRDVSLLVVAGRQAAGLEDETPLTIVRAECQELNVLDSTNFATEVGKLGFRLSGPPKLRAAKANRHHFEEASTLIQRMVNGGNA